MRSDGESLLGSESVKLENKKQKKRAPTWGRGRGRHQVGEVCCVGSSWVQRNLIRIWDLHLYTRNSMCPFFLQLSLWSRVFWKQQKWPVWKQLSKYLDRICAHDVSKLRFTLLETTRMQELKHPTHPWVTWTHGFPRWVHWKWSLELLTGACLQFIQKLQNRHPRSLTARLTEKLPGPKRRGSSSNRHFSGANC